MYKKFLLLIILLLSGSAFAGELERAMASKAHVFLYLYTPQCGYCKRFEPNYHKISNMYNKNIAFVKINANTEYGHSLIKKYNARYVPFVYLIDSKSKQGYHVSSSCLLDRACLDRICSNVNK